MLAQAVVFFLAAIAPVDAVGLAQGGHVGHPGKQPGVLDVRGGVEIQALHGGCVHRELPKLKNSLFKGSDPGERGERPGAGADAERCL
ncbi:hypothetical protein D3C72_2360940 [compost metagenome]